MSEKYEPSPNEREEAPEAFKYELEMFRIAFERRSNEQDNFFSNVMLECALLHARNLLEFFTGKSNKDNIIASHFVNEPPQLPYLKSLWNDINKRLSHLTYTRVKAEKKYRWNLSKISDEIEAAYSEFLDFLPEEDRSKWPESEHSDVERC